MSKPKGGRGKRASYKTTVVRVPEPIVPQVLELIDQFHKNENSLPPLTTSIKKIPALSVNLFHRMSHENKLSEKEQEEYIRLSKLINEIIWQIDNTFKGVSISERGTDFTNAGDAIDLLIKYGLIELPKNTKAVTVKQFAEWYFGLDFNLSSIEEAGSWAFNEEKYDIVAALGILNKPPITDRKQYWRQIYSAQLGQPDVDFWKWSRNPESKEIATELTLLLDNIPEPNRYAKLVLMHLAEGKNPFLKIEKPDNSNPYSGFNEWNNSGYFGQCQQLWEERKIYHQSFVDWHNHALKLIGHQKLLQVYKVVFNCAWAIIDEILQSLPPQIPKPVTGKNQWSHILGVPQNATPDMVKAAYKKLVKHWHPDYNKSPEATEMMVNINNAMDEYENSQN